MGGIDKGLVEVGGKPMIEHVVQRLKPQVLHVVINANRNMDEYSRWSKHVIKDFSDNFDGPLAGMASGLEYADTDFVATVPCDSPLLAKDYVQRMFVACTTENADLAVATDGNRLQPVFTLLKRTLLPSIQSFLDSGERKIDRWFRQHSITEVDFSDCPDCFLNVNTPDDKRQLNLHNVW